MARPFSVYKRTANLVDLIWEAVPGIKSYKFEYSSNFDGTFTDMQEVPAGGFSSPSVLPDGAFVNLRQSVRFRFNPSDYSISDSDPFFLRVTPVDWAGVEGDTGPMQMIVPYGTQPNRPIILSGTSVQGADVSESLIIHLPSQVVGANIKVQSGSPLVISFEEEGDEYKIFSTGPGLDNNFPSFSAIRLRGDGGDSVFSAMFSLRNNGLI